MDEALKIEFSLPCTGGRNRLENIPESFTFMNLPGVSTKLESDIFSMQTYKELIIAWPIVIKNLHFISAVHFVQRLHHKDLIKYLKWS